MLTHFRFYYNTPWRRLQENLKIFQKNDVNNERGRGINYRERTVADHTAEKFEADIVEAFPDYAEGETLVVLRSSHTCLPRSAVEALVWRAESEKKNIFFGAGWVLVNGEDKSEAKYVPLKAGAALLSSADYPFVAECLRHEILKKLLRHGVIIENTDGVYEILIGASSSDVR